MGEASRSLSLLLGIGDVGADIVRQLCLQIEEDPGFHSTMESRLVALTVTPQETGQPQSMAQVHRCFPSPSLLGDELPGPGPWTESIYPSQDGFMHAAFASAMMDVLLPELEALLTTHTDASNTHVHLDIWVPGSIDDAYYRSALFPIVVALKHVALSRFEALFRTLGPMLNANFQVMPIAISANLKALGTGERHELVELLGTLERYNDEAYRRQGERAAGGALVQPSMPRLYLIDGFSGSAKLSGPDQIRLVTNLLLLAHRTGLRQRGELRDLFRFNPGERDLLTIVTLATLEFPVTLYRNYCVLRATQGLLEHVIAEPSEEDEHAVILEHVLAPVLDGGNLERLRRRFRRNDLNEAYVDLVEQNLPDFVEYVPSTDEPSAVWEDRLPPARTLMLPEKREEANPLFDQTTFLPLIQRRHQPDELAGFFGERWLEHPQDHLACGPPTPIPALYSRFLKEMNGKGYQTMQEMVTRFGEGLDRFLATPSPPSLVPSTVRYLERLLLSRFESDRREVGESLRDLLPGSPRGDRFREFAGILRDRIWKRLSLWYMLLWAPVLALVMFFVLQHLVPEIDWLAETFPFLETYYTDDPLRADPVRRRIPQVVLAGTISLLFVLTTMLLSNESAFRSMRRLLRSPMPYLAQLRRLQRQVEVEQDEDEFDDDAMREERRFGRETSSLARKARKATKKLGLLHHEVEQMRNEYRLYWQARLQLCADVWVFRVLTALRDAIDENLGHLRTLHSVLREHQLAVEDRLKQLGVSDPRAPGRDGPLYPEEAPYHTLLLDRASVDLFYSQYRNFGTEREAAQILLHEGRLLEDWRIESGALHSLGGLLRSAEVLFPALTTGPFNLSLFQERIDEQLQTFLNTLEGRLSGGIHFAMFASTDKEADRFIEDTGVLIVTPPSAHQQVEVAARRARLSHVRILGGSEDPNRIYALRMFRDISVQTLAHFLGLELRGSTLPEEEDTMDVDADPWAPLKRIRSSGRRR